METMQAMGTIREVSSRFNESFESDAMRVKTLVALYEANMNGVYAGEHVGSSVIESAIELALEAVLQLKSMIKCPVILTGSNAAVLLGIVGVDNVKIENNDGKYTRESDIDIILVDPSLEDMSIVKGLAGMYPAFEHVDSYAKSKWEVFAQYKFHGVRVDVFIQKYNDTSGITGMSINTFPCVRYQGNYIYLNPLHNIIKARIRMGREKDYRSIMMIVSRLVSWVLTLNNKKSDNGKNT